MLWPLFVAGVAFMFFGAWSIDFAHVAWEDWIPFAYDAGRAGDPLPQRPRVGIPGIQKDHLVDAAFWWNANFFVGIVGGSILVILGAVL